MRRIQGMDAFVGAIFRLAPKIFDVWLNFGHFGRACNGFLWVELRFSATLKDAFFAASFAHWPRLRWAVFLQFGFQQRKKMGRDALHILMHSCV